MGSCHGCGFEVDGVEVAEGGVASGRVVERVSPVEDRLGEPGSGGPSVPVEKFALQRREEAFGDGIVQGVADGSHRAEQTGTAEPLSEHPRAVVRSVIRVNDRAGGG